MSIHLQQPSIALVKQHQSYALLLGCADELADEEIVTPATRLLTLGLCNVASSFAVAETRTIAKPISSRIASVGNMALRNVLVALTVSCLALAVSAAPALTRTQLILPQQVQQDQSQNCQLCIAAVTVGEGFLIGSGEVQDLIKALTNNLCSRFAAEQQQECVEIVPAVAAGVIQWARTHWPAEKICQGVELCDASALTDAEVLAMMDDSAAMLKAANPGLQAAIGDGEECDTCKLIVTQVAAMLRNPDTQKEILVYAHEACHVFPGFEDQCEVYVNMYGPLVLGIVQQYLQPDAMCGRLGFCPLPPPPINV